MREWGTDISGTGLSAGALLLTRLNVLLEHTLNRARTAAARHLDGVVVGGAGGLSVSEPSELVKAGTIKRPGARETASERSGVKVKAGDKRTQWPGERGPGAEAEGHDEYGLGAEQASSALCWAHNGLQLLLPCSSKQSAALRRLQPLASRTARRAELTARTAACIQHALACARMHSLRSSGGATHRSRHDYSCMSKRGESNFVVEPAISMCARKGPRMASPILALPLWLEIGREARSRPKHAHPTVHLLTHLTPAEAI